MTRRAGNRDSTGVRLRKNIAVVVKERSPNYFILIFILVSIILQVIGVVTSDWLVLDVKSNNPVFEEPIDIQLGLIYVKYCLKEVCKTDLVDTFAHEKYGVTEKDLRKYRIEAGVGLLMTILITIFTCRLTCCNKNGTSNRCVLNIIVVLSVFAGGAIFVLVAAFGTDTLEHHRDLGTNSPFKLPYSLIMSAAGGLFAVFAAIMALIELCRSCCCCCDSGAHSSFSVDAIDSRK